ncbi:MAG: 4Fe-4S binding protein [Treponema sp.]|nr:4Fe-4S binding protein [Treponema sp.]
MSRLILHTDLCKGCEYCVANCPRSAISLSGAINKGGYNTPAIDQDKCVVCGICYNVCPDVVYEILA